MQTLLKASNHQGALSLFPWCCRIVLPYVFFPLTGRVHCESTPYPSPPPNHPPMVYSSHTVHTIDVTSPHVVAYSLSHPNSWSTCNALSDPPQEDARCSALIVHRHADMQIDLDPLRFILWNTHNPTVKASTSTENNCSDKHSAGTIQTPHIYRCLMFIWNM